MSRSQGPRPGQEAERETVLGDTAYGRRSERMGIRTLTLSLSAVLNRLVSDLQSFLLVLDNENLSYIAQAQKKSISDLLSKLQDTPGKENGKGLNPTVHPRKPGELKVRKQNQGPVVPPYPPNGLEDDCYEEAEPFVPTSQPTVDSDSSLYESYDEEEDFVKDRAHYIQWSASQPSLRAAPESRICGYLWRKKWLGQWTKQLFIVRNTVLLCYKCAKDLNPLLELELTGCQVVYKSKHGKKMQHELKVVAGSDTVVMGFHSCQQAEEWRKIIEEVSGYSHYEKESHSSSSILKCDRLDSCRSSTVLHTDSDEDKLSGLPSAASSVEVRNKGFLNVLMNCQWQSLWCQVEDNVLQMFCDEVCEDSPQYSVQLKGCEVRPGPDTPQAYRITVSQHGDQVAVLEASCADEKERWLQLLLDGSVGSADHPYEHLDSTANTGADRPLSFWFLPSSVLMTRRFPTSNMYTDDPFQQLCGTGTTQPIYSNTCIVENMFQKSQSSAKGDPAISKDLGKCNNSEVFANHSQKTGEEPRWGVQKLDLTGKRRVQLRAESEVNLASASKPPKRSSFRQSLAFCSEKAQGGFLTPLLRRTASAKNSLKRAPSAIFIEKGKVFQRKKEWETKAFA
ncbi:actin filament-associated protein 1-like 2-like [Scleropages formosus]|uniref:Actin filament-associated protein 1-like 2-like n=1 Tax=Scleropages formosus TaxID=113540 RepID=A0A0P7WXB5_SCLFO|nr:actin filament-associated protein 1-like 2-like [Scleropages formosus]